ncbi:hypothetical protein [Luteolibacter sp. Populi]|uniref:hypothetical protein n=1 Tax=Luteolibacter sp. Populi TaxID=3230487 RepID=UPI0034667CAC
MDIHLGLSANRMRRNRAALDQLLDEGVLPAGIQPGGVPELSGILAREGPGDWSSRYDQLANARMEVIPHVGLRYRARDLQRAMTAEERRTLEEQRDQLDGLSKFFGDIGVSGIRIKHDADTLEHSGLLDTLGDTAVMMGGSLPEMGMAAAPGGLMLPAIFTSHFERHLAGLRADNPDLPEARLAPTAFASALTDTALSRAEILFVGGKLPGLRGALAKLGTAEGKIGVLTARAAATGEKLAASGLPGKALANGAGFAGRSTATIGTEVLQNVTPDVWKSVTHALHQDIKGADWDTVLARERAALGDTALLSMGLVVAFGTGRRALDFIGEGELRTLLTDRRGLLEQGLSPVDVERVVETAQYSPAEAADLVKQAADTTPVEERREQILILQEQMEQEQQMGEEEMMGEEESNENLASEDALHENTLEQGSALLETGNWATILDVLLQPDREQGGLPLPEKRADPGGYGSRGPDDGEVQQASEQSDLLSSLLDDSPQDQEGPGSEALPRAFEEEIPTTLDTSGNGSGDFLKSGPKQLEPAADWTRHPRFQKPSKDKGSFLGEIGNSLFALSDKTADAIGLPRGTTIPWKRGIPDFTDHAVLGPKGVPSNFSVEGMTGDPKSDPPLMIRHMASLAKMSQDAVRNWLKANRVRLHHSGGNGVQIVPKKLHELHHSGGALELREKN